MSRAFPWELNPTERSNPHEHRHNHGNAEQQAEGAEGEGEIGEGRGAKPKKPSKSPVAYSEALATEICVRTAEGQSLRTIASAEGMPSLRCLTLWQQQHKDFAVALDRAREARADMRIEEIADVTAQIRSGQLDPHAGRAALEGLKYLAGRENWRKWGDKQAVVAAVETRSYDEAGVGRSDAGEESLRRLRQLADRQRLLGKPQISDVRDGVDLAPPLQPPPPTKADTINKVPDRVIDNDLEFKGEPAAEGRPVQERPGAVHTGEFTQLKCTGERPEILDRDRYATPHVVANDHFGRSRRRAD